ncbi:MAG: hypothetical protein ABIH72_01530 [archaeon]
MLINNDITCIECKEAIYNPLCPFCLAEGVEAWLENKTTTVRRVVANEIKRVLRARKFSNSVQCVACNQNRTFLCPYCFTEVIYYKLKEIKVSQEVLEEFMALFNFDFEHGGYYKDAEKLGIV